MANDEFREQPDEPTDVPTDEQMHEWFPKLFGWIDEELAAIEAEDAAGE